MSACQNCKVKLSCGCQKRVASNGAPVCSNCLANYENSIKSKNAVNTPTPPYTAGSTAPSNVKVFYTPKK
jgi:hypothetical protein